jgi:hypothetical protein
MISKSLSRKDESFPLFRGAALILLSALEIAGEAETFALLPNTEFEEDATEFADGAASNGSESDRRSWLTT